MRASNRTRWRTNNKLERRSAKTLSCTHAHTHTTTNQLFVIGRSVATSSKFGIKFLNIKITLPFAVDQAFFPGALIIHFLCCLPKWNACCLGDLGAALTPTFPLLIAGRLRVQL